MKKGKVGKEAKQDGYPQIGGRVSSLSLHHSITPSLNHLLVQTAVLLIAAAFRLVWLHGVPPGLAQDEVLNADIVTFIRGGEHALFFRHGFGHEPLYHYFGVPFQILLGDNVMSMRLPAVFLGMLLIAATMRWVRRDFGANTAVFTGIGLAVSWWPIIFSRVGLRPIMEPLLLVGMAWFWKRPLLAGLFLGLSFYTYTGARVVLLIPIFFAAVYWLFRRDWGLGSGDWGSGIGDRGLSTTHYPLTTFYFSLFTLTALAVAAPMQITLWRNPELQQRVDQLSGPLDALREGDVGPIWETTTRTLGVFSFTGDPRWTYMVAERPLFDPIISIFFYAGLLIAISRIRQPKYLLMLIWFGVALIPSAVTPQAPSTIRIIGALPLVYLMPALGLEWIVSRVTYHVSRRWVTSYKLQVTKRFILLPSALLLLLFTVYFSLLTFRTVTLGFTQWPQNAEVQEKYQTVLLGMSRYWGSAESSNAPVVADAFYEPIDADSFRRNLGRNPDARWVQLGANAGAVVWPSGQVSELLVPEFAPLPDGLRRQAGIAPEPLYRLSDAPSFAVYQLPRLETAVFNQDVLFNDAIRLVGVEIEHVEAGRPFELFTYWEVVAPLPWDLTAFVHVLGDDPAPVRQHDGFDVAPERLQIGDIVLQRHLFALPDDRERPYALTVGLYTSQSGVRWTQNQSDTDVWVIDPEFLFDGNEHDE